MTDAEHCAEAPRFSKHGTLLFPVIIDGKQRWQTNATLEKERK